MTHSRWRRSAAIAVLLAAAWRAEAGGVPATGLDEIVVTAGRMPLDGTSRTASEGTVFAEQLENRPLLRAGELLLGLERHRTDGPWQLPQDLEKSNAILHHSAGSAEGSLAIDLMGYRGDWRAGIDFRRNGIAPVEDVHFHPVKPRTIRLTLEAQF